MPKIADALDRESRTVDLERGDFERLLLRRERKERNRRIRAGVLSLVVVIAVGWLGLSAIRSAPPIPADPPSEDLGIFAPLAGRYVVGSPSGIYGVAPAGTTLAPRRIQLTTEPGIPLGWSSDGTRLLIEQWLRDGRVTNGNGGNQDTTRLIILHADGSETVVTERRTNRAGRAQFFDGAAISPDGSHVVFATYDDPRLWIVDADGGPPEVLFENGPHRHDVYEPAYSPDGTEIAFVVGGGTTAIACGSWTPTAATCTRSWKTRRPWASVTWTASRGRRLAIGSRSCSIIKAAPTPSRPTVPASHELRPPGGTCRPTDRSSHAVRGIRKASRQIDPSSPAGAGRFECPRIRTGWRRLRRRSGRLERGQDRGRPFRRGLLRLVWRVLGRGIDVVAGRQVPRRPSLHRLWRRGAVPRGRRDQ